MVTTGNGSLGNKDSRIGPTGKYPNGPMNKNDAGELAVAISTNKKKGIITIDFGTSLSWLGLTVDDAKMLVKILNERIDDLET